MLKLSQAFSKCIKTSNRPLMSIFFSSSAPVPETQQSPPVVSKPKLSSGIVSAAFAALQADDTPSSVLTPFTDGRIAKARTVNELLSVSEGSGVSRRHALKVVSVLADWSSSGKIALADFETDPRFLKLCRLLSKTGPKITKPSSVARHEDLSTILSITADDEAAKLVGSITLPQMVKVMSTLANRKRRSTTLLRALSYNMTANSDKLDLKQSSDLLYSMSTLNFIDENLFIKICNDICCQLDNNFKYSAIVGSILTGLGLVKYKNPDVLDCLSEWILNNHNICRPQDIFAFILTLGALNHIPSNAEKVFQVLLPQLSQSDAKKSTFWLDVVWSLVILNKATEEHLSSVLSENFINNIEKISENMSAKLKLLNIDGAVEYIFKDYKGPRLPPTSLIHNINLGRTREKLEMVESVIGSLKNLIQSDDNLKTHINSGFGFFIDAKILLDQKCTSFPINLENETRNGVSKIAILMYDYHDMCKGKVEPTGVNVLIANILKQQKYKILTIPYTEFKINDKLIQRVKYLETKLKEIVDC